MLRGTAEEEGEMYFSFASAPILYVTPCNATGHGRGGVLSTLLLCDFVGWIRSIQPSPLCFRREI